MRNADVESPVMPEHSLGVLYVATGGVHRDEMIASARTVRRHLPGVPILAYTDQTDLPPDVFSEIRTLARPRHSFVDKIAPLRETPFERTLFLDTDTWLCGSVADLFDVLDRFEMALAHAPLRHDREFVTPNCFAELNTGVLAYRCTAAVDNLFSDWLRVYEEEVKTTGRMDSDQPAFREAIYRSQVNFYVLPSEYNLRTVMPAAVGRCAVRIIHGRASDLAEVERWVNESRSIRLFLPETLQLTRRHFAILSGPGRIVSALLTALVAPFAAAERVLRTVKRRLLGNRRR